MKAVIQRVREASVEVDGEVVGSIGRGLLVLLGVARGDAAADADLLAAKTVDLRIFPGDDGKKMDRSVAEVGGAVLCVSQFTLLADCRGGRRPAFTGAAPGPEAEPLYRRYVEAVARRGVPVAEGRFAAMMDVALVNTGPVTIVLDSRPSAGT